MFKVQLLFI